jgi:predicted amidohydrolase
MKVGFYQFCPQHGKKDVNIEEILRVIKRAKADFLLFPELATSGYLVPNIEFLKKNAFSVPDSKEFETFLKISRDYKIGFSVGFPEKYKNKFYNSAFFVLPDGRFGVYRKMHLFYKEKLFFKSGSVLDSGIFEYNGARFGTIICFDWIFPETVRYLAFKKKVHIVLHLTNLVLPWAQRAMRIRAIENRVFTLLANRIGEEKYRKDYYKFTGKSQLVSPGGEILLRANSSSQVLKIKEINPLLAEDKNITPFNNLFKDLKIKVRF